MVLVFRLPGGAGLDAIAQLRRGRGGAMGTPHAIHNEQSAGRRGPFPASRIAESQ